MGKHVRSYELRLTVEVVEGKCAGWYQIGVGPDGQTQWWNDQGNEPAAGWRQEREAILDSVTDWLKAVQENSPLFM